MARAPLSRRLSDHEQRIVTRFILEKLGQGRFRGVVASDDLPACLDDRVVQPEEWAAMTQLERLELVCGVTADQVFDEHEKAWDLWIRAQRAERELEPSDTWWPTCQYALEKIPTDHAQDVSEPRLRRSLESWVYSGRYLPRLVCQSVEKAVRQYRRSIDAGTTISRPHGFLWDLIEREARDLEDEERAKSELGKKPEEAVA
ncbi:MAG: hypothetical protein AB7S38_28835 [Vulcanimicrobiota bacterium]